MPKMATPPQRAAAAPSAQGAIVRQHRYDDAAQGAGPFRRFLNNPLAPPPDPADAAKNAGGSKKGGRACGVGGAHRRGTHGTS